ncbi:MAG: hypothetical protein WAK86_07185 [Pseudonocardiaceae bacterium]
MSMRTSVAIASIIVVGVLGAGCSAPTRPAEPSTSPSPTETLTETLRPTPAPGVSWLRVSPQQGAPGAPVSLDVACLDGLGAVHSPVLDIGALKGNPDGHQPWNVFGTATVRPDAAPGQYQISARCGASELSAAITVVAAPPR